MKKGRLWGAKEGEGSNRSSKPWWRWSPTHEKLRREFAHLTLGTTPQSHIEPVNGLFYYKQGLRVSSSVIVTSSKASTFYFVGIKSQWIIWYSIFIICCEIWQ